MPVSDDARLLDLAARVALRGMGHVEPNPMVGCVLARDGTIIGIGHHRRFGGPHAEVEALNDCQQRGNDPRGATAYITLEPCCHVGKTPPCTDALIRAGVHSVVAAMRDPGPASKGGADVLARHGIQTRFTDASPLATALSEPFRKRVVTGLPWVIAKWAQTIDGRIATRTGESKWISGAPARRRVQRLRGRVDAILTGLGTVSADDPRFTVREGPPPRRIARRVVLDPMLQIPPTATLVRTAHEIPTLVACGPEAPQQARRTLTDAAVVVLEVPPAPGGLDIAALLRRLAAEFGTATVLVESGAILLGSLFEADLVDEALIDIAPLLLGDEQARPAASGRVAASLADGRRFQLCRAKPLGPDVELLYRRTRTGG